MVSYRVEHQDWVTSYGVEIDSVFFKEDPSRLDDAVRISRECALVDHLKMRPYGRSVSYVQCELTLPSGMVGIFLTYNPDRTPESEKEFLSKVLSNLVGQAYEKFSRE